MADSDARDDRYDDDRPSRRDDDDRPKKKSNALKIVLILLGVVGVLCAGACGGGYLWLQNWAEGLAKAAESTADTQVKKIGSGDMTAAYNGMSGSYKARYTQPKFEEAMKAAKLTDAQSVTWNKPIPPKQGQTAITFTGTATLKSGDTTPVTVVLRMMPDFKTWEIDDVTGGQ
jgi:hypothetical protein